MKKSDAAISYVLFNKAKELEIDPILFSSTIKFIIANPKQVYDETDIHPAIHSFLDLIDGLIKTNQPGFKHFSSVDNEGYAKTALFQFSEKYRTNNFVASIFRDCKKEIKAVIHYNEMVDTHFSQEDIVKALDDYR